LKPYRAKGSIKDQSSCAFFLGVPCSVQRRMNFSPSATMISRFFFPIALRSRSASASE
jgi:hypothetical protein